MTDKIDLTPEAVAETVHRLRTKWPVGPGNMIVCMVMKEAADMLEAIAARVAELEAERDQKQAAIETAWASRDRVADERDEAIRMTMQNAIHTETAEAEAAALRDESARLWDEMKDATK